MIRDASLHILQHALGLDDYGRGQRGSRHHAFDSYREHFVATECPGGKTWELLLAHVAAGRMTQHGPHAMYGGENSYTFIVTNLGREYVRDHSPKPPVLSRGKRRWQAYRSLAEVSDISFGEWLKRGGEKYNEQLLKEAMATYGDDD